MSVAPVGCSSAFISHDEWTSICAGFALCCKLESIDLSHDALSIELQLVGHQIHLMLILPAIHFPAGGNRSQFLVFGSSSSACLDLVINPLGEALEALTSLAALPVVIDSEIGRIAAVHRVEMR